MIHWWESCHHRRVGASPWYRGAKPPRNCRRWPPRQQQADLATSSSPESPSRSPSSPISWNHNHHRTTKINHWNHEIRVPNKYNNELRDAEWERADSRVRWFGLISHCVGIGKSWNQSEAAKSEIEREKERETRK